MAIFEIIKYKIKSAIRSKELYLYIIGFPLIFLIIYGSLAATSYSKPTTINIGILNNDQGVAYYLGDNQINANFGQEFYKFLDKLYYEDTNIKMFNIQEISSREDGENKVSKLDIAAVVCLYENFSEIVLNYSKSMTYLMLVGAISNKMRLAYQSGNITLANLYLAALQELYTLGNETVKLSIELIGDPTYSKSMTTYELLWKYFIQYVFTTAQNLTIQYANYLENKYQIEILNTINIDSEGLSTSINVKFTRIGSGGETRESFMQMYYAVLVPGQIIQSIMIAAISAIYMVGIDIEKGIIHRIKLTKITSKEYIGGTLISWGGIALVQSFIMIGISFVLGYIKFTGDPINYLLSLVILTLSGILTAAFSIIVVSFVSEKTAGPISLIVLLTLSLYIAGYFPMPNPKIGTFMGREFTQLDFIPWRAGITGLRKSLMLSNIVKPIEVLPDLTLLTIWTLIYTIIAFITFEKMKMRKRK